MVRVVFLLALVPTLLTCTSGEGPAAPLSCSTNLAGNYRWFLTTACNISAAGETTVVQNSGACTITADLTTPQQAAVDTHTSLVASLNDGVAKLTIDNGPCAVQDQGTVSLDGSKFRVTLNRTGPAGCCPGKYTVLFDR